MAKLRRIVEVLMVFELIAHIAIFSQEMEKVIGIVILNTAARVLSVAVLEAVEEEDLYLDLHVDLDPSKVLFFQWKRRKIISTK